MNAKVPPELNIAITVILWWWHWWWWMVALVIAWKKERERYISMVDCARQQERQWQWKPSFWRTTVANNYRAGIISTIDLYLYPAACLPSPVCFSFPYKGQLLPLKAPSINCETVNGGLSSLLPAWFWQSWSKVQRRNAIVAFAKTEARTCRELNHTYTELAISIFFAPRNNWCYQVRVYFAFYNLIGQLDYLCSDIWMSEFITSNSYTL